MGHGCGYEEAPDGTIISTCGMCGKGDPLFHVRGQPYWVRHPRQNCCADAWNYPQYPENCCTIYLHLKEAEKRLETFEEISVTRLLDLEADIVDLRVERDAYRRLAEEWQSEAEKYS